VLIYLTLERFIDFRQVAEALAEDPTNSFSNASSRYHIRRENARL
jgi:hypothetical protein